MPSTTTPGEPAFFDAGIFIAAVLEGHPQDGLILAGPPSALSRVAR